MQPLANPKQNELCLPWGISAARNWKGGEMVRSHTYLQSACGNDDTAFVASLVSIHPKALYYEPGNGHNSELDQVYGSSGH